MSKKNPQGAKKLGFFAPINKKQKDGQLIPLRRSKKTGEIFDFVEHNQKIATLRGATWRKALQKKKLDLNETPTCLKILRVSFGYSQRDFFPKVGVPNQSAMARIERAEKFATPNQAIKIARKLDSSVDYLFIQTGPNKYLAV